MFKKTNLLYFPSSFVFFLSSFFFLKHLLFFIFKQDGALHVGLTFTGGGDGIGTIIGIPYITIIGDIGVIPFIIVQEEIKDNVVITILVFIVSFWVTNGSVTVGNRNTTSFNLRKIGARVLNTSTAKNQRLRIIGLNQLLGV